MKLVSLFSGGIDSPVAAKLMIERGCDVTLLFFDNRPYAGEGARDAAIVAMKKLEKLGATAGYVIPNGANQKRIVESCDLKFTCLFCKRNMVRCAEGIAKNIGAAAIITGETLGSKASQTSTNLGAIADATSLSVLRPLIGFDKEEIISLSRSYDIFTSTNSQTLCCTAVPNAPSTRARIGFLRDEEKKLGDLGEMVDETLKGKEKIF